MDEQGSNHSRRGAQVAAGRSDGGHRLIRAAVAAALLAVAGVVWIDLVAYRSSEAWLSGQVAHLLTGTHIWVSGVNSVFYVDVGTPRVFGLKVTSECTSAIVTIGFLAITAVLVAVSRFRLRRLAAAAAIAVGVFVALNIARLVLIALATRQWHNSGYEWTHVWAGSFVTVLGGVAVCALYIALVMGRGRPARHGGS